jgi:K+-transporting ATPase ATPase A chain
MTAQGILQIAFYVILLTLLAPPLGRYIARVYQGEGVLLTRLLGPAERATYRLIGRR